MARSLYKNIFNKIITVSSLEIAELAKLFENSYRLINISFVNEMAEICDKMNIDVWEVIEAAKTKPFGFSAFYPGPGIGGHCIPVDPLYLQWKARKFGVESKFIQLSIEVNRSIPHYIVNRLHDLLIEKLQSQPIRILVYGIAYKQDINDARESPALELIRLLEETGYIVHYHDPYIPEIVVCDRTYTSVKITNEMLLHTDCVIIFMNHSTLPLEQIITYAPLVFDTQHVTFGVKGIKSLRHVYRLGSGINSSL